MTAITCNSKSWASLLACSGVAMSLPAVAAPAATHSTLDSGLEEITVTAEKYKSTIQDTPISLSAVSGEQLDAAGITSVEALPSTRP
jgi:iron complex outermembrane receptor protein